MPKSEHDIYRCIDITRVTNQSTRRLDIINLDPEAYNVYIEYPTERRMSSIPLVNLNNRPDKGIKGFAVRASRTISQELIETARALCMYTRVHVSPANPPLTYPSVRREVAEIFPGSHFSPKHTHTHTNSWLHTCSHIPRHAGARGN